MIAEGSSSSSQTPVPRGGASQPPSERDLLAERRARRAAESDENALLRRAETAEATVKTLEGHISSLQRRLEEAEQDGRRTSELAERLEKVESALQAIRESHRRMATTVSELKGVAMRLRAAVDSELPRGSSPVSPRSEEMADALAAAVERLRARAEATVAQRPDTPSVPPIVREPHKHSMSLIGRWRLRRKQRRGR
jgi:DNA repair exonuclease SbcCD ATPase subunit